MAFITGAPDGFPVHAEIVRSEIIRKKAQLVPITAWTAEPSTLPDESQITRI